MQLFKRLLSYLKPYKKRLILGIICMMLTGILSVAFFGEFFGQFIDEIVSSYIEEEISSGQLNLILFGVFLLFFFRAIFQYGEKYLIDYVSKISVRDIRDDLYQHLQKLSLDYYAENNTGKIMSRATNDVGQLESSIASGAVRIFNYSFTLLIGIIKLFYDNWRLALITFVVTPLIAAVIVYFNKRIRKVSKRVQEEIADVSDILQETLSGIRVVKCFGREKYEAKRFAKQNHANFKANMKNRQLKATLSPVTEFLASMSFIIVLRYGAFEVAQGQMTIGELIGFFALLLYIVNPLKSITKLSGTIQRALAAAERIFSVIDIKPNVVDKEDAIELEQIKEGIEFSNLSFSYQNEDELALDKINFKVELGEMVAFVGPSGAGKSTLANLIPRFYELNQGQIKIDGVNIKDIKISSLRDKIGIVPQENILFSGSIADNIRYGKLDASQKEIIAAAKSANAHDFILEFPQGYETNLGERGKGLSGGQKQRIAIARALLKDPKILILDEATSALDTESEALVQEALERLMENRTSFVIAHRLSTIVDADKIIVLKNGKIIEQGSHNQLLKQDGLYSHLYQVQFNRGE